MNIGDIPEAHRAFLEAWIAYGGWNAKRDSLLQRFPNQTIETIESAEGLKYGHVGLDHTVINGVLVEGLQKHWVNPKSLRRLENKLANIGESGDPFYQEQLGTAGRSRSKWARVLCVPCLDPVGRQVFVSYTDWLSEPDRTRLNIAWERLFNKWPHDIKDIVYAQSLSDALTFPRAAEALLDPQVTQDWRIVQVIESVLAAVSVNAPVLTASDSPPVANYLLHR